MKNILFSILIALLVILAFTPNTSAQDYTHDGVYLKGRKPASAKVLSMKLHIPRMAHAWR